MMQKEIPEYSRSSHAQTDYIPNLVTAEDLIYLCSFFDQLFCFFYRLWTNQVFCDKN